MKKEEVIKEQLRKLDHSHTSVEQALSDVYDAGAGAGPSEEKDEEFNDEDTQLIDHGGDEAQEGEVNDADESEDEAPEVESDEAPKAKPKKKAKK